jgi:hypothetical protein
MKIEQIGFANGNENGKEKERGGSCGEFKATTEK